MKRPVFTGAAVAIITPMNADGSINFDELGRIIDDQIANGTDAIVICGTTGESPALDHNEHTDCIRYAVEKTAHRVPVIAGSGSNDTAYAIRLSREAQAAGADGLLLVTPYYNKTSQAGLIAHYTAIADAVDIPCILYNVPSRTGVDIPVSVYQSLARIPNIAGVKEASGDITKIARIRAQCPEEFAVWSGNDNQAAAVMALGGSGVISVVSNVLPDQTLSMARAALDGDFDTAADLQIRLLPLIEALFSEVNPIPVKAAMKLIGYDCGECRLPLTPISQENLKKLKAILLPS